MAEWEDDRSIRVSLDLDSNKHLVVLLQHTGLVYSAASAASFLSSCSFCDRFLVEGAGFEPYTSGDKSTLVEVDVNSFVLVVKVETCATAVVLTAVITTMFAASSENLHFDEGVYAIRER